MRWSPLFLLVGCSAPVDFDPDTDGPPIPPPTDDPVWAFESTDKPNAQLLTLVLPESEPVAVLCTAQDDPEEVVGATVDDPDRWQEVVIYGLLADTTYDCAWTAGPWTGAEVVHTDPPPDWVPSWTVTGTPGWGEWTLFSTGKTEGERNQQILIVDGAGRLRWAHRVSTKDVPDIDASYIGGGQVLYGGGYHLKPTVVDLSGEVQRRAIASTTGEVYHHHAERLSTGEVLAMSLQYHTVDDETFRGFTVETLDPSLAARTWSWNSQQGLDDGWLQPPQFGSSDPYHPNSVQDVGDAVLVNIRHLHKVVKIDKATGERVWSFGKEGDFELLDLDGQPLGEEDWAWGAHAPELNGDRMLMHDNGWHRPGAASAFTRVVEYQLDDQAMTATLLWEYTEPRWYEAIWGDVDRLPDDGVLITRGHGGGSHPDLRTEVVELGPGDPGEVLWRLTMGEHADGGYRAQRLEACELFDHRGVCPSQQ